jgi:hypothetical protein
MGHDDGDVAQRRQGATMIGHENNGAMVAGTRDATRLESQVCIFIIFFYLLSLTFI